MMPFRYSNHEYADMVFMYGFCNGSAAEAVNQYKIKFPNRRAPCSITIARCFQSLSETGHFPQSNSEREITRRNSADEVLHEIQLDNRTSLRKISAKTQQSTRTIHRTLRENGYHPYHIQPVQSLLLGDHPQRVAYCTWLKNNFKLIPRTLYCDEANFTRDGMNNHHNEHVWVTENPHAVIETNSQYRFTVNVWGGIIGKYLLGPHIFDGPLNADMYRRFLEESLPLLMEAVPVELQRDMWYMQDGAPPHYGRIVTVFLNQRFPNRWIGRNGPIHWPARSPDLNPLDFYLWGHLKTIVYGRGKPNTKEELIIRINEAFQEVRENFENVDWQGELRKRTEQCIEAAGGHFEQL